MEQEEDTKGTGWIDRIEQMDRRWIFSIMAVVMIIPLIVTIPLPLAPTKPVLAFHDYIESLSPGTKVLVADDWDPGSKAELLTASHAVHTHLARRGIKVIDLTLWETGTGIVRDNLNETWKKYDRTYGEDYVFLGVKPGREAAIVTLAQNIPNTFPEDYYKTPIAEIAIMEGIENIKSLPLIITVSAGYPGTKEWVQQVRNRYDVPMICATGGVSAPEYYPYYESGQLSGLIGGLKAMAEYEKLVGVEKGFATKAMGAQSFAHYTLVALIAVGNVLYLIKKRKGPGR